MEKFFITTAIPYPNGSPHLGFALEIIQADTIARWQRLRGKDVFFLTGTDEHGLKVFRSAQKERVSPQEYVDRNSTEFVNLKNVLNISYDDFIRTTDKEKHWPGAIKLWQESKKDIYLKEYEGLYCVGCEAFVTKKELLDGLCPEHKIEPEVVSEKNYFFKLSTYNDRIRETIENDEIEIIPSSRKGEVLNLIKDAGDFSISRPREKIPWGIPVPENPEQNFYVWFDALVNYISAIGYGRDEENFNRLWPADLHCVGKGVLRFHALYWPAMLLSAGLPLPKKILAHGYLTVDGEKISKSLGNVISPKTAAEKYGIDPVRYFLLREIPTTEDGDFSYKKLEDRYNGDLANNLGNLVSRTAKLIETRLNGELIFNPRFLDKEVTDKIEQTKEAASAAVGEFKLHEALAEIWKLFTFTNVYIDKNKPWDETANPDQVIKTLTGCVAAIIEGAKLLEAFLPETAEKIFKIFGYENRKPLAEFKFVVLPDAKSRLLFPKLS